MKPAHGLALLALGLLAGPASGAENRPRPSQLAPDVQDLVFMGPMRPLLFRLHITVNGQPFRQAWLERFNELFAAEDRDGDGRVTVEQGDTIARDMNGSLRDPPKSTAKDSLLRSAASADGTVDRPTLLVYIDRVLPAFTLRRRAVIAQGDALALFPLLDTDHNHQLSAAELDAAEVQLMQRDFDDNRVITGPELILDPNAIAAAADPGAADRQLDPDDSSVLLVDASTTAAQVADRLLKHYDRNRDGRLTTTAPDIEIKLPAELMAKLDTSRDGALDRDELAQFVDRRPDLELNFALGHVTAAESRNRQRPAVEPGFRVRKTLFDGYKLNLGEADIDFKCNNRDPQQADLAEFRSFDTDKNDYIDSKEASANNIGRAAFAEMDTDGDGKIVKGEFTSFMNRQNAAASMRLQLEVSDRGQDLFKVLDTDQDGVLSPRELRNAKDVLIAGDKNGDGSLNGDEIPQFTVFELVRGVDDRVEADAKVARGRSAVSVSKAGTAGPLWFRKMDRNNDGDLSPHEFVGPLEAFQKLDANHDGLIDREEAEAAGK
jgi:Ca2+-binding EF-hand superfamily protein